MPHTFVQITTCTNIRDLFSGFKNNCNKKSRTIFIMAQSQPAFCTKTNLKKKVNLIMKIGKVGLQKNGFVGPIARSTKKNT